ncbi:hypothetical protein C8J57DRAFT_1556278 [Mycena rebaudengoi]|nr:hypothetical protein C8J57DRAFT_1556278 [Mycena rebaudengoi]
MFSWNVRGSATCHLPVMEGMGVVAAPRKDRRVITESSETELATVLCSVHITGRKHMRARRGVMKPPECPAFRKSLVMGTYAMRVMVVVARHRSPNVTHSLPVKEPVLHYGLKIKPEPSELKQKHEYWNTTLTAPLLANLRIVKIDTAPLLANLWLARRGQHHMKWRKRARLSKPPQLPIVAPVLSAKTDAAAPQGGQVVVAPACMLLADPSKYIASRLRGNYWEVGVWFLSDLMPYVRLSPNTPLDSGARWVAIGRCVDIAKFKSVGWDRR